MSAPISCHEPSSFFQGDSISWSKNPDNYPAPTYTLTYYFRGPSTLTVSAAATGSGFLLSLTPAQTGALNPGQYQYQAVVTSSAGDAITISSGSFIVNGSLTQEGVTDNRSFAVKALAAVEAALLGQLPAGFQSMTVNGKSLSRYSKTELFMVRDRLRTEVAAQMRAAGLGQSGSIAVRFSKPAAIPPTDSSYNWPI